MAFQVIWTRQGEVSLEEVHDGLAAIDAGAADRLLQGIFDTVDILQRFPFIGARYERRGRQTSYREILYGRYRVFYRVDQERQFVYVMRIWHSSRDEPTFRE
jgi:plasmid stabilization system protein ParE